MKPSLLVTAMITGAFSMGALAENPNSRARANCASNVNGLDTCTMEITIPKGMVSWYITSQTEGKPGLKVERVGNAESNEDLPVMQTSVFSPDLSNKSFGNFEVVTPGVYKLTFSNIRQLEMDQASIVNNVLGTLVSTTYQFAGEDSFDNDLTDVFASFTWFKREEITPQ